MQQLCFKIRPKAKTVQIVRHAYCPTIKRSRTTTVGSFSRDADPGNFMPDLRLRDGIELTKDDLRRIAEWLTENEDPVAAHRRQETLRRIEARLRSELMAELTPSGNSVGNALKALRIATEELPNMTREVRTRGGDVWKAMRPRYLAVLAEWEQFQGVAKALGITKQVGRGAPADPEMPESEGVKQGS